MPDPPLAEPSDSSSLSRASLSVRYATLLDPLIPLGIRSTRGTREYNEDRFRAVTLELPDAQREGSPLKEANRAYFGIFDGLTANLHKKIESARAPDLPATFSDLRNLGGYFLRFPVPPVLTPLLEALKSGSTDIDLTLEQRLTLAFLRADVDCIRSMEPGVVDGSTASIVIVEPKDGTPFWESGQIDLVVGHVGDTR
ncbi:hypothetical protein BC938DRAFT_471994 [Jimgerdemannia flammicorona]|uniref:Uncharacterized protein n=1 Tax=Jimgerdemannia flammicorona TaxID=994334 RepID=A0A433Q6Z0_9FUNG|nr:hypothetical protein BC938DRAFT_471994 [Jimgerdemannia flammicorona]